MSGHGFKLAPAVGELMAAIVTGVEPPVSGAIPPRPFRVARDGGTFVASYLR